MDAVRSRVRRPGLVFGSAAVAGAVVIGVAAFSVSEATNSTDAVQVDDDMVAVLVNAATSCPALTGARLAGQIMAASGFEPTPDGGIGALTAEQWQVWAPTSGAVPSDANASVLALAHLTCDLVGQVRVTGVEGDHWRLAVAAWQSSVAQVQAAEGVPSAVAAFLTRVDSYAAWYALQPGLVPPLAQSATLPPTPTPTPTPTPSATATPTPSATTTSSSPTTTQPRVVRWDYPRFDNASGLRLNGSAGVAGGRLNLAAGTAQAGSAWSTTTIDTSTSFTTSFAAVVTKLTDGLAFVIQAQGPTALGPSGGGLGYGARPSDQATVIRSSVAIELDTWDNSSDGIDPAKQQHIAVLTNGDITRHIAWRDPGFSMYGGAPTYVWVSYNAGTRTLQVFASKSSAQPTSPLLSVQLDLRSVIGNATAYVGFTGGTGRTSITDAEEAVLSWSLRSG